MEIQPGIKMFTEIKNISQKLYINNGVKKGSGFNIYKDVKYSDNSYIPIMRWRHLSHAELSLFLANDDNLNPARGIGLYKLPDSLSVYFKKLELHSCSDRNDVLTVFRKNQEITEMVNSELERLLSLYSSSFDFFKMVVSRPKQETLTFYDNNKQFEFLGLHIDRSAQFDFINVENMRNRISINISPESRYLYVINLTLNQILEKFKKETSLDIKEISIHNIAEYFFENFPTYPVIKIVQEPYEFYIAPTDNFLHDGSTLDKERIDITLVYLGYFNLHANV